MPKQLSLFKIINCFRTESLCPVVRNLSDTMAVCLLNHGHISCKKEVRSYILAMTVKVLQLPFIVRRLYYRGDPNCGVTSLLR